MAHTWDGPARPEGMRPGFILEKETGMSAAVTSVSDINPAVGHSGSAPFSLGQRFSPTWILDLASDDSPRGRLLLANTISELFDHGSATEQEIIADILMHIVQRSELDVRRALGERLARQINAPHDLIAWLANDEISVARPVIALSEVLQDDDLMAIIQQRDSQYRCAIAQRPALGRRVVQALILTHDEPVLETLLENEAIELEEGAMRLLLQAAKHSEPLKKRVIVRPELRSDLALNIYWWVSQELRTSIQTRFGLQRAVIDEALEATLQEILDTRSSGLETVTPEIQYVAQQLMAARRITSSLLITVLRRGQANMFIALFAEVLRLPADKVGGMLSHASGEFLAVCCRAQGILKPDFASIFLLGRAGRTTERVVNPEELSKTLKFYDQLSHGHATMLLDRWQRNPDSLNLTQPDVSVALSMLAGVV